MKSLTALRNAAKHSKGELPTVLEIEKEERIESLKEAFIEDEISEEDFDTLLDAAFDNDAPFRADWFMRQPASRRKRYAEKDIYLYFDEEYVVEGDMVVPADSDEIDRTVNVRGGSTPDEDEVEFVEEGEEASDEAKQMQEEIRESLGLD